jgi:hypothetical protein
MRPRRSSIAEFPGTNAHQNPKLGKAIAVVERAKAETRLARKNSLSGKSVSSPSRKNISLSPSGKSLI